MTKALNIKWAKGSDSDLRGLAEWIKESGLDVRMQLQLHKYVWGAETRGV